MLTSYPYAIEVLREIEKQCSATDESIEHLRRIIARNRSAKLDLRELFSREFRSRSPLPQATQARMVSRLARGGFARESKAAPIRANLSPMLVNVAAYETIALIRLRNCDTQYLQAHIQSRAESLSCCDGSLTALDVSFTIQKLMIEVVASAQDPQLFERYRASNLIALSYGIAFNAIPSQIKAMSDQALAVICHIKSRDFRDAARACASMRILEIKL